VHKDNIRAACLSVQSILDKWSNILPDDPTVRSNWSTTCRAGTDPPFGEKVSSEGNRTYTMAKMASLSSILTAEDKDIQVTPSSNNYLDLTFTSISIPNPNAPQVQSYLQAAMTSPQQIPPPAPFHAIPSPAPTPNKLGMQAEIIKLKRMLAAMINQN
jgi:hypothetical protein